MWSLSNEDTRRVAVNIVVDVYITYSVLSRHLANIL